MGGGRRAGAGAGPGPRGTGGGGARGAEPLHGRAAGAGRRGAGGGGGAARPAVLRGGVPRRRGGGAAAVLFGAAGQAERTDRLELPPGAPHADVPGRLHEAVGGVDRADRPPTGVLVQPPLPPHTAPPTARVGLEGPLGNIPGGFRLRRCSFVFCDNPCPPTAVGCPLTAVGYPLTAVGCPLTAVGYPLTAVGYPLTAVGCPAGVD